MKRFALALIFLVLGTGITIAEPSQVYCAVFSGSICFDINDDDNWTHKIVIDFSIDEIQFGKSAHITVYQGLGLSEQEDVGTTSTVKTYESPSGTVEIVVGSKTKPRYFDVHFKPKTGWGVVQVFGYVSDDTQAQALANFMVSIHPCTRDNLSVSCAADTPFLDAAKFVRVMLNELK